MAKDYCDTGLDDRCRDSDGEIRQKRSDTLLRTLRDTYGDDFAEGYRSDMKLENLLKNEHVTSLSELVKRHKK